MPNEVNWYCNSGAFNSCQAACDLGPDTRPVLVQPVMQGGAVDPKISGVGLDRGARGVLVERDGVTLELLFNRSCLAWWQITFPSIMLVSRCPPNGGQVPSISAGRTWAIIYC